MVVDLTNRYKVNEEKGIVKYTVKAHGEYYTGVAKETNFEEGDVFDLEKGKRIAKLRAILKMKRGTFERSTFNSKRLCVKSSHKKKTFKITFKLFIQQTLRKN